MIRIWLLAAMAGAMVVGFRPQNTPSTPSQADGAPTGRLTTGPAAPEATVESHLIATPLKSAGRTALAQTYPVSEIDPRNSGYPIERSECLTIALGKNAAAECGNLRVVQPLPSVRAFNTNFEPTLIYNSEFAHPYPIVPVTIRQAATTDQPLSVEVKIFIGIYGQPLSLRATNTWSGSDFPPGGAAKRVSLTWDALAFNDTTGYYYYEAEVTNIYAGGVRYKNPTYNPASGKMFIINRSKSMFGPGWSLAGYERLMNLNQMEKVWIGGDGSARFFLNWRGDTSWTPTYERNDDKIIRNSVTGEWTRYLPEGRTVVFSPQGFHARTVNRFGRQTVFGHTNDSVLTSITLPSPTGHAYQLAYTSFRLTSVTAPGVGSPRVTTLVNPNPGNLTSITPAGDFAIGFSYKSTTGDQFLMDTRTDRRGIPTTFTYDAARRIASSTVNPGTGAPIVRTITAGESRALPGTPPLDLNAVYTTIDGPRSGISDVTTIRSQRFGHPRFILGPVADTTKISHDGCAGADLDCSWLVFSTVGPTHAIANYDWDMFGAARGHLNSMTTIDTALGAPVIATTRYEYENTFNQLTKIVPPEGDSVMFGINTINGRREWQQDARGPSSRVNFSYADPTYVEQVTSMITAAVNGTTSTFNYAYSPTSRNLTSETTPLGHVTRYTLDAIGRVTLTDSPRDSIPTSGFRTRRGVTYSVRGDLLVDSTFAFDSTVSGTVTIPEKVIVRSFYNPEGQVDSLIRTMVPDFAPLDTMRTRWTYDGAGRAIRELSPDGKTDSTVYDEASNVVARYGRRSPAVGPVTMVYDGANRLQSRTYPAVAYAFRSYPAPPDTFSAFTVPGETENFSYRADGLLRTADNTSAQVSRVYTPLGRMVAETLKVASVAKTNFTQHVYVTQSRYDRNGRRVTLRVPAQLAPGGDSIRYTFNGWGSLASVIDHRGNTFNYLYNERNELIERAAPLAQVTQRWRYDGDGQLIHDSLGVGVLGFPGFWTGTLRRNEVRYDGRGKMLKSSGLFGVRDTLENRYSGLGYLVFSRIRQFGIFDTSNDSLVYRSRDSTLFDGLGNIVTKLTGDTTRAWAGNTQVVSKSGRDSTFVHYQGHVGRDTLSGTVDRGPRRSKYDNAGNLDLTVKAPGSGDWSFREARGNYYDGLNRIARVDYRTILVGNLKTVLEEYRYDALGRRVWARAQKDYTCPTSCLTPSTVNGYVRRTVWDGTQELAEIQMPGNPGDAAHFENDVAAVQLPLGGADRNPFYGRVIYAHGDQVDRPLSVTRYNHVDYYESAGSYVWPTYTLLPFWSITGQAVGGAFSDGKAQKLKSPGATSCASAPLSQRCLSISWPGAKPAWNPTYGYDPVAFQGTLLDEKRDAVGTYYRRNRSFDPFSGRFTQEDPIGLAGGVNLYGFANGDPLNFSDPFGLCPGCGDPLKPRVYRPGVLGTLLMAIGTAASDYLSGVRYRMTSPDALSELGMGIIMSIGSGGVARSGGLRAVAGAALRSEAANLAEQLAMREARAGAGQEIMKGKIVDARYPESAWAKISHTHSNPDGTLIEIHYWRNRQTGVTEGFKFKNP